MPDGAVLAVLDGVLERVTFANPATGYTIARIAPERGSGVGAELVTAVGPLLGAQVGEFLRLRGRWSSHPKYGRQFEVHSYTTVLPATAAGIQRYLGSGLIKGIGPVMAERMVAHFGVDIMHVIEDSPARLIEVDGLGPKRTAMIAAAWAEQKAIKEVMIFLQGVGVSTSLAVRIYKKYGDASVSVVDPSRTGWPRTCGASASRPRTRSPRGRHRPRQPGADQGRPGLHPVRGGRRRPLLPARAQPGRGRREDPRRASRADHPVPGRARRRRRGYPRGCSGCGGPARPAPHRPAPHRPAPHRPAPHRGFRPCTCRPFIRPNGPWPQPCCACRPRGVTGSLASRPWTGTRPWAGCAGGPAPRLRRSRPTRCGSR